MGIVDRLGDVLRSYLNSEDTRIFGRERENFGTGDPDLKAAWDELDELLGQKKTAEKDGAGPAETPAAERKNSPPEELRPDFVCLGVPFGAPAEACKAAYKDLIKIHHPDRHAGHPGNLKKATEKTARINAAWDRIEAWRKTQ